MSENNLTPREVLIDKLESKTIHLSYSKLKNLTSPINFISSILEPKIRNQGMSIGTLVDEIIKSYSYFMETYKVVSNSPSTDAQHNYVNEVLILLEGVKTDDTDILSIEVKDAMSKVKKGNIKTVGFDEYILYTKLGKKLISQSDYDTVITIYNGLMDSDEICAELSLVDSFEHKMEFEYLGWNFICYLDTFNMEGFSDFKYSSNFIPERWKFEVEKYKYDIQIGVYALAYEVLHDITSPKVNHIVFDSIGNNMIIGFDDAYVQYCKKKVDYLVRCLDKMINEKAYNKSYGFFKRNFKIYKSNFAEGFDYEIFND